MKRCVFARLVANRKNALIQIDSTSVMSHSIGAASWQSAALESSGKLDQSRLFVTDHGRRCTGQQLNINCTKASHRYLIASR